MIQEFLPNTYPIGAANPCPACPAGFVYLTSNGSSTRDAGQLQLRRRLRNGLTRDGAIHIREGDRRRGGGVYRGKPRRRLRSRRTGCDLDAERGAVEFRSAPPVDGAVPVHDRRGHRRRRAASMVCGGTLLKGWTVTSQFTAGSGLPLTPIYLAPVPGTGVTGTIRAGITGASSVASAGGCTRTRPHSPRPAPASGATPAETRSAVRRTFSLDAGIGRSFPWGTAAHARLADRSDQRAESRHLHGREHDCRQPAIRTRRSRRTRCGSCRAVCG